MPVTIPLFHRTQKEAQRTRLFLTCPAALCRGQELVSPPSGHPGLEWQCCKRVSLTGQQDGGTGEGTALHTDQLCYTVASEPKLGAARSS
jgi:hypothetical protein